MPRFSYRAIKVKNFGNAKTRRGWWTGSGVTTSLQNALFFGRLYVINSIMDSLNYDGYSPEVYEVDVSSTAAQVIPPTHAAVPTFTLKRSSTHPIGPT